MSNTNSMAALMREAEREDREKRMVERRYCDRAMAMKKGLLPCNNNCKTCIACIEVLYGGERRHFSGMRSK